MLGFASLINSEIRTLITYHPYLQTKSWVRSRLIAMVCRLMFEYIFSKIAMEAFGEVAIVADVQDVASHTTNHSIIPVYPTGSPPDRLEFIACFLVARHRRYFIRAATSY